MSHRRGFQALGTAEALRLERAGLTCPGKDWNQVRSSGRCRGLGRRQGLDAQGFLGSFGRVLDLKCDEKLGSHLVIIMT